jgi:hypothetical protein
MGSGVVKIRREGCEARIRTAEIASTICSMWILGALFLVLVVTVLGLAVWASVRHRRTYPPGTRIQGRDGGRRRGLRWIGITYGGGRG